MGEKVVLSDFPVMCRTCALPFDSQVLRDITPPTREMLQFCVGIEVDVMGELPTRICGTCFYRADAASQFKLQCQRAHEALSSCLRRAAGASGTPRCEDDEMSIGSPKWVMSDANESLPSMRCDSAALSDLLQNAVAGASTPNFEEASNMTTLINDLIEEAAPEDIASSTPRRDHIINPDSVLSFLEKDDVKMDNLDDSLNLLRHFGSPISTEVNKQIPSTQKHAVNGVSLGEWDSMEANGNLFNGDDNHRDIIILDNDDNLLKDSSIASNESEKTVVKVEQNIKMESETNVNCNALKELEGIQEQPLLMKCEKEEETNIEKKIKNDLNNSNEMKIKDVIIKVIDFMKFLLPKKLLATEIESLKYVRCRFCYLKFKNGSKLLNHLLKYHSQDAANCTDTIDYVRELLPEKTVKDKLQHNASIRCPCCYRCTFRKVKMLYNHMRSAHYRKCMYIVHTGSKFKCDTCSKEFYSKHNLKLHIQKHMSGIHDQVCDKCGIVTKSLAAWKLHMRSHQVKVISEKKEVKAGAFMCPECGKLYTTQSNLSQHRLRHNKDRPFKCNVCEKAFSVPVDLKHHSRIHNKSYLCYVCSKTFGRSDHLRSHMRMHLTERLFQCDCGARFKRRQLLDKHIKFVHRRVVPMEE